MRSQSNHAKQVSTDCMTTTRVILVRHGRSTFNELKLYQGSSDASVLTEQGYQTACQVGQFLATESIDAIYISPLKRARQTVDALVTSINAAVPQRLEIHPSLREIEMGDWEGRSFQEIQQTEAEAYQSWKQRPHEFKLKPSQAASVAGGRSTATVAVQMHDYPVLELYDRAQHFWQEILPRHAGGTIMVVSHGGTNRALISTAIGLSPIHFHKLQQSNCGVSILHFPGGCLKAGHLKTLNLTTPIGETLPKLKEGKQGLRLLLLPAESTAKSAVAIADLLRGGSIEFSLTHTAKNVQSLAQQILRFHPETIQLQSQQPHFLHHWQQAIATKSNDSAPLMTGLVVAESAEVQQILGNAIGLNPLDYWRLQVQPGTLSILHYPASNRSPVVQAVNFGRR